MATDDDDDGDGDDGGDHDHDHDDVDDDDFSWGRLPGDLQERRRRASQEKLRRGNPTRAWYEGAEGDSPYDVDKPASTTSHAPAVRA